MSKFLKKTEVATLLGICTRQICLLPNFPKPVKIIKSDRWLQSEIQEWVSSQVAERDAGSAL